MFAGINVVVAPRTTTATRSRPTSTAMNVVKLLAIVVVTAAVTLLCIRSGQAMAKAPVTVPAPGVYPTPETMTTTVADPTRNATAPADAGRAAQAASRSLDGGGPVGIPAARTAGTYRPDLTDRDDVDDAEEDDTVDNHRRPANIIVDAGVYNVQRYNLSYTKITVSKQFNCYSGGRILEGETM